MPPFKHGVYVGVNSPYINKMLSAGTIVLMPRRARAVHQSLQRLLDCARRSTAGKPVAVASLADLARRLNVAPQVINNWATRGVSKDGALIAQRELGCSAHWVLDGEGAMHAASPAAPPPPPTPPRDFSAKHKITASEWQLLSDLEAFPKEDREALLQELHAKADKFRAYAREVIERIGNGTKN